MQWPCCLVKFLWINYIFLRTCSLLINTVLKCTLVALLKYRSDPKSGEWNYCILSWSTMLPYKRAFQYMTAQWAKIPALDWVTSNVFFYQSSQLCRTLSWTVRWATLSRAAREQPSATQRLAPPTRARRWKTRHSLRKQRVNRAHHRWSGRQGCVCPSSSVKINVMDPDPDAIAMMNPES